MCKLEKQSDSSDVFLLIEFVETIELYLVDDRKINNIYGGTDDIYVCKSRI